MSPKSLLSKHDYCEERTLEYQHDPHANVTQKCNAQHKASIDEHNETFDEW